MSAETAIQEIIDANIARAQELSDAAISAAEAAELAAISVTTVPPPLTIYAPEVEVPPPENIDQGALFEQGYDGAFDDYGPAFSTQWQQFITDFFPDVMGCIRDNSDNWICNTIANGGTGIPAAVENAIWDRARAREAEANQQATEEATNAWAMRGFTLPPGVLVNRTNRASEEYQKKVSTINRDIAIKNIEIEIQNIRFAIEQATALRKSAVEAAIGYLRTWFLVPQTAINKAEAQSRARLQFYASTAAYYNALIGAAELTLRADITNATLKEQNTANFVNLVNSAVNSRVRAAVGATSTLGGSAAAALSALNALANIANITQQ